MADPTFPLNVQAGSLQYTLSSQITPSSSTTTITVTIINTGLVTPVSNAYYTIQNEDGSKWCTFYVESWVQDGGFVPADAPITFTGSCTYSSSNTSDVFPEGSTCWCVWTKEYYDSIISAISSTQTGIPPGAIMAFATNSNPKGWLFCNGAAVSRTDYAELFAAIGTTYGSGDGRTTFNLPNLQGKMVLGYNGSHPLAQTGGSETVTLTTAQMPSHSHTASITINSSGEHTHNIVHADGQRGNLESINTTAVVSPSTMSGMINTSGSHTHSGTCSIYSTGNGQPHSNMPPYQVARYCIKT